VLLLTLQSMFAITCRGDVDGRSSQPLFGPVLRCGDMWMSSSNSKIQTLLGRWSIQERHNIDEFMEALGFASWQRALIARAGQSTTLEHGVDEHGDTLRIVTQDLRGTSQLELPLSGGDVSANDGDGGARVCRSATIERGAKPSVVVTERFPHEREPYSICRRTLQADGRMCIDVTKRTAKGKSVAMRAIAARQDG